MLVESAILRHCAAATPFGKLFDTTKFRPDHLDPKLNFGIPERFWQQNVDTDSSFTESGPNFEMAHQ